MIYESFESTIDRIMKSKTVEKIICFILCLVVGMICAIDCYHVVDKVPATFDDYYPLNEKLLAAEGNPASFLDGDCEIVINNGTIKYTIENTECEMTGTYDSQYNLIDKKQNDKYMNYIAANFVCLLIFVFVALCIYVVLLIVIYIVYLIITIIIAVVKKYRKPKKINEVIDEDGNIVYSEYGKTDYTCDEEDDFEEDDSEENTTEEVDNEEDNSDEDDSVDETEEDDENSCSSDDYKEDKAEVDTESEVTETAKKDESSEEVKQD